MNEQYVSFACPWAQRTLITRRLKGLEDMISFTCVHWHMGDKGRVIRVEIHAHVRPRSWF